MPDLLSLLPNDVYLVIARFITRLPNPHRRALEFAGNCEARRQAVVEAFSKTLILDRNEMDIFEKLVDLFGNNIVKLKVNISNPQLLSTLRNLPMLIQAKVSASETHLRIIKGAARLVALTLETTDEACWETVIETLKSLPSLKRLYLKIMSGKESHSNPPKEILLRMAEACGRVAQLQIVGVYNGFHRYWPFVINLPSLKDIVLVGCLGISQVEFLQSLREVRLLGISSILGAAEVGKSVKMILQATPESENNLQELIHCPNLTCLHVVLKPGAEKALVGKLKKALSLALRWEAVTVGESIEEQKAVYFRPEGEVLVRLIKSTWKLRAIGLIGANIPKECLRRILRLIGERLTFLETQLDHQDEPEARRLATVLDEISRSCQNVNRVIFRKNGREICAKDRDIKGCFLSLAKVKRSCPKLETSSILKSIYYFRRVPMKRTLAEFLSG